jgi:hypothetical protein
MRCYNFLQATGDPSVGEDGMSRGIVISTFVEVLCCVIFYSIGLF